MTLPVEAPAVRFTQVGPARVAYRESGSGPTVLLLHGCPFSSFVWRGVMARLATRYRCLAPDLLGLGDTETPADADWSLRSQSMMVLGFLDALGIGRTHVVGHDHGGAVAQILAVEHADRVDRLVLSDVEAYDNWPSAEERPFIRLTQIPILGDAILWLWSLRPFFKRALVGGKAVHDPGVLTPDLLDGYIRANLGDRHRRAKTKRFLSGQTDPEHNRVTVDLARKLGRIEALTLLIWGRDDPHFGPEWGERLRVDIPGAVGLELLPDTGHLVMEERPETFASLVDRFLSDPRPARGGA